MEITLQIALIVGILCYFLLLLKYLIQKRLNIKYTLLWLFSVAVLLITAIFPQVIFKIAGVFGFVAPINLIYILAAAFGLLILLSLTVIVSSMNEKIIKLVQNQALLEKRIRELEKK